MHFVLSQFCVFDVKRNEEQDLQLLFEMEGTQRDRRGKCGGKI